MPDLSRSGAMSIVAHQDDDILFMNPDILASIEAGQPNTTVFITAGDAGLGDWYWQGRELGAKAAYTSMSGTDVWVDETIPVTTGSGAFEIASSYLQDDPDIRLYFLRLPDGGGALAEEDQQQLARLTDGNLDRVLSKDGQSYTRDDVTGVLTGLMDLHAPSLFRLQVNDGDTAAAEHTDHVHTSELSEDALQAYDGGVVEVIHYVHYDSRLLPANLSETDAARALEIMQAYAEHDPAVLAPDATLSPVYETWTQRQYIDERYMLDTDADADEEAPADMPGEVWPAPGTWTYSIAGEDAFLYQISPLTGEVAPKDWFIPSLDDAWDQDEDHLYEVTRIATSLDGTQMATQDLILGTVAEGAQIISWAGDTEGLDTGESDTPASGDDGTGDDDTGDDGTVDDGTGDDDTGDDGTVDDGTGDDDTGDDGTVDDGTVDEDTVDDGTGDDGTGDDGTVDDGTGDDDAGDDGTGDDDTGDDGTSGEGTADDDTGDDGATDDSPPAGTVYALGGTDAFLFQIDAITGEISPQGWYTPSLDDAWDRNEDFVHELTRIATLPDETRVLSEIRLQTTAEGVLTPLDGSAGSPDRATPPDAETPVDPPLPPDDPANDEDPLPPYDPANDEAPTPPDDPANDEDPTPPDTPGGGLSGLVYGLSGPDSQLFTIEAETGEIALQTWFAPPDGDAWDRNEDFVYEITRSGYSADGTEQSRVDLRYETLSDGSLSLLPGAEEIMTMLMTEDRDTSADDDGDADDTDDTDAMDLLV